MAGTLVVIVESGKGATVVGLLEGTVVFVGRSVGATVVVAVIGTGVGSILVEQSAGKLVEGLAETIVVTVAVNRGAVAGRLTGIGTRTGTAIIYLICSLALLTLPSRFF